MAIAATLAPAHALGQPPWFSLAFGIDNPNPILGCPGDFGRAVALRGPTIFVAAPLGCQDESDPQTGAVYTFNTVTGLLTGTIPNPDPDSNDEFGAAIAVTEALILIGAPMDSTGFVEAGSAYLFDDDGSFLGAMQSPIATPSDLFGSAVGFLGGDPLVSAPTDDVGTPRSGTLYLFDSETLALQQRFLNPTPATDDEFGISFSADNSSVVVGAPGDDTAGDDAGAAYLFAPDAALLKTFLNPEPGLVFNEHFGKSVVNLPTEVLIASDRAAYLFDKVTGGLIRPFEPHLGQFVYSVVALDDLVVVNVSASTLVFDRTTGETLQELTPAFDPGAAVATDANTVVIGNLFSVAVSGPVRVYDACGTGIVAAGEDCDDGNTLNGDCCSSRCGFEDLGNPCDDGNACTLFDQCELGTCVGNPMTCSDGITQAGCGEQCDDGNLVSGDGCDANCTVTACGNGIVTDGEACDDGNLVSDDGCDASCAPEPTPIATPTPSPTVTETPSGLPLILGKGARGCQAALASRARSFAVTLHKQLQKCLDRVAKDFASGKDGARVAAVCQRALDASNPRSTVARARTRAFAQIARKCVGIVPQDLASPCDESAATMDEAADCVLNEYALHVDAMVGRTYPDACVTLGVVGLGGTLPVTCGSPVVTGDPS